MAGRTAYDHALDQLSSSPFLPHLNTNYAPSQLESAQIVGLIHQPLASLSSLSTSISNAKHALQRLEEKKCLIEHGIEQHRQLLAPIRRLPNEVLQEIFARCLPNGGMGVLSPHDAPALLMRICKQWRALVSSTPALWSALHLVIPHQKWTLGPLSDAHDDDDDGYEPAEGLSSHKSLTLRYIHRLKSHLSHTSSITPLTLSLFQPSSLRHAWYVGASERIPELLLESRSRIVELHLVNLTESMLRLFLFRYGAEEWPNLRIIKLDCSVPPGSDSRGSEVSLSPLFRTSSLRHVTLRNVDVDPITLPFDWRELRTLEVSGSAATPSVWMSVQDARSVAGICERLERWRVGVMYKDPEEVGSSGDLDNAHHGEDEARASDDVEQSEMDGVQEPRDEGEGAGPDGVEQLAKPTVVTMLPHLTSLDLFDAPFDTHQLPFLSPFLQAPVLKELVYRSLYVPLGESNSPAPFPSEYATSDPPHGSLPAMESSLSSRRWEGSAHSFAQSSTRLSPLQSHPAWEGYEPLHTHTLLTFLSSQPKPTLLQTFTVHADSMPEGVLVGCLRLMGALKALRVWDAKPLTALSRSPERDSVKVVETGSGTCEWDGMILGDAFLRALNRGGGAQPDRPVADVSSAHRGVDWIGQAEGRMGNEGEGDREGRGLGEGPMVEAICPALESLSVSRSVFSEGALATFVRLRTECVQKERGWVSLSKCKSTAWAMPAAKSPSASIIGKGKEKEKELGAGDRQKFCLSTSDSTSSNSDPGVKRRLEKLEVGLARYRPLRWEVEEGCTVDGQDFDEDQEVVGAEGAGEVAEGKDGSGDEDEDEGTGDRGEGEIPKRRLGNNEGTNWWEGEAGRPSATLTAPGVIDHDDTTNEPSTPTRPPSSASPSWPSTLLGTNSGQRSTNTFRERRRRRTTNFALEKHLEGTFGVKAVIIYASLRPPSKSTNANCADRGGEGGWRPAPGEGAGRFEEDQDAWVS